MNKIYWIHHYSLDIAASAVAISLVLANTFSSSFPQYFSNKPSLEINLLTPLFLLFFSVLFVYHFDHFLDNKKITQKENKNNEAITQPTLHSSSLPSPTPKLHLTVILLSAGFNLFIIIYNFLTTTSYSSEYSFLIFSGLFLLAIIVFYLFSVYFFEEKIFFLKEAFVSFLFSVGIFIPLLSRLEFSSHLPLQPLLYFTFIQLWMITFHNAIIYSYFRKYGDGLNTVKSLWNWGNLSSNKLASRVITLIGLFTLFFILSSPNIFEVSLPKAWNIYLIFIIILQQIIFNLGKKKTNPRLEILCLDSIFIIGFLIQLALPL